MWPLGAIVDFNIFIAFSSDLLELYCQEFVYTILFMNKNYLKVYTRELISIFICLLQVLASQKVGLLFSLPVQKSYSSQHGIGVGVGVSKC